MTISDILNKLNISEKPQLNQGTAVIDITGSNEFSKYYSVLNKSEFLEEDESSGSLDLDHANI